jgi:hypothetical protein
MRRPAHTSLSCALSWLMRRAGVVPSASTAAGFLFVLSSLLVLTACGLTSQQRILYESAGIQVGILTDLSTNEHASPPVRNRHPADLSPKDIRSLLGSLEVSGWSGIIVGLFSHPQPKPVFTEAEIVLLAEPLAAAFHEATPRERVFFVIQNLAASYDTDRTSGSLFFRDEYLHVILTDHYAFLKADTGGGETRDPRDTKGMKLWVVGPAQAATVPSMQEPHWTAFEKVHISLKPAEVLAAQRTSPTTADPSRQVAVPAAGQPALKSDTAATNTTESVNDMRAQLKEQSGMIEKLKAELEQLRNEIKTGASKPSSGPQPPRKQTTP